MDSFFFLFVFSFILFLFLSPFVPFDFLFRGPIIAHSRFSFLLYSPPAAASIDILCFSLFLEGFGSFLSWAKQGSFFGLLDGAFFFGHHHQSGMGWLTFWDGMRIFGVRLGGFPIFLFLLSLSLSLLSSIIITFS